VSSNSLIALASVLTGLGATAAAVVAAYALRAQQRGQQRQHDLENLRWLTSQYAELREMRQRAARSLLDGELDEYAIREVLNFFESCGFMVRENFITVRTFGETIGLVPTTAWWLASESVVREVRARVGPGIYEHFEWLKAELDTEGLNPSEEWIDAFVRREATLPTFAEES
jgi:hypothetical protein